MRKLLVWIGICFGTKIFLDVVLFSTGKTFSIQVLYTKSFISCIAIRLLFYFSLINVSLQSYICIAKLYYTYCWENKYKHNGHRNNCVVLNENRKKSMAKVRIIMPSVPIGSKIILGAKMRSLWFFGHGKALTFLGNCSRKSRNTFLPGQCVVWFDWLSGAGLWPRFLIPTSTWKDLA